MNCKHIILLLAMVSISLYSCQESYIPDTYSDEPDYVIEGFVEAGESTNQCYILITKSVPFLEEIGPEILAELYVKDAEVDISDGDQTIRLTQVCLSDLPDELKEEFTNQLGLDPSTLDFDYCLYIDLFDQLTREFGRRYDLRIQIGEKTITAHTTIPELVALDTVYFTEIPGDPIDTLAQMWAYVKDPVGANFYRYFTDDGSGRLAPPAFGSVTDDVFFDGDEFEFPLTKGSVRGADTDPNTFGFFVVGDTTLLKWVCIDKEQFDFWYSYESNLNNQGPFATYTRVNHNIEGALGIFGGLAVDYHALVVRK